MILFGQRLSKDKHPFIVAEISCSHEGSLEQAKELIKAAKEATADAVKIQVYDAYDMTLPLSTNDFWIKSGNWQDRNLFDLYLQTQTPYEWVPELFAHAKEIGIPIFASVFSLKGLALLEELGCEAYKIASFELIDLPLIRKVAKTNKTVILSTGMANLNEIDQAVQCVNPDNSIIMHCVSSYPTKFQEANLWNIDQLQRFYKQPIGFSDHGQNMLAAQLAVAKGAVIIERHLGLGGGEDKEFSLTPMNFKIYVIACKQVAEACWKTEVPGEQASKQFRRSLYVVKDIEKGENFTPSNVRSIRPSYGLPPSMYNTVIISRAACYLKAGTALKKEHLV